MGGVILKTRAIRGALNSAKRAQKGEKVDQKGVWWIEENLIH